MGCDIHIYSEYKTDYGWEFSSKVQNDRDYWLFGVIAGVRADENQVFSPKGFPEDANYDTRTLYEGWDGDAHSASWLTLTELKTLVDKKIKISGLMDAEQKKKLLAKEPYDLHYLYPYCQGSTDMTQVRFEIELPLTTKCDQLEQWIRHLEGIHGGDSARVVFWFDN